MTQKELVTTIQLITIADGAEAILNHFSRLTYSDNQLILESKEWVSEPYEVDLIMPFNPEEHNIEWAARVIKAAAF